MKNKGMYIYTEGSNLQRESSRMSIENYEKNKFCGVIEHSGEKETELKMIKVHERWRVLFRLNARSR